MASIQDNPRFRLGVRDTLRLLVPYVKRNFMNQIRSIWFIVAYLALFQLFILDLPIVFASMICFGIIVVAVGLMFFMEGLRLGLMPLGEVIGSVLPRNSRMPAILLFALVLGAGATFAEPAISVLKSAGSSVSPFDAPLLYSLLNDFSGQLVACVAFGVGCAVMLGILRFFYAWPLKYLVIPVVLLLLGLSLFFSQIPELNDVLGLAWDCGAVTTGPVTVPLVLALGIGVCRVVSSGSGSGEHSGFGIVTLASLFPILAVLLLALFHYANDDYYGQPHYTGSTVSTLALSPDENITATDEGSDENTSHHITDAEFSQYLNDGILPTAYTLKFDAGHSVLIDGEIVIYNPVVRVKKQPVRSDALFDDNTWDTSLTLMDQTWQAFKEALRAIIPLCLFMFIVLRLFLGQSLNRGADVAIGVIFALIGMSLFGLGIALGLTPLGGQLGGNIPVTFSQITPWGLEQSEGPMFASEHWGKMLAIIFSFFLGYGATLAEPALNALGDTVDRLTSGAFRKKLLMQSVAIGVGLGIGFGVMKMAYNLPLTWLLVPGYTLVLVLTCLAPNSFVNFSWDSAGVTTGPITVPLVLAMGLGVGANVPGVSDGFGILALASVGPILTVLIVGLYTQHSDQTIRTIDEDASESATTLSPLKA